MTNRQSQRSAQEKFPSTPRSNGGNTQVSEIAQRLPHIFHTYSTRSPCIYPTNYLCIQRASIQDSCISVHPRTQNQSHTRAHTFMRARTHSLTHTHTHTHIHAQILMHTHAHTIMGMHSCTHPFMLTPMGTHRWLTQHEEHFVLDKRGGKYTITLVRVHVPYS